MNDGEGRGDTGTDRTASIDPFRAEFDDRALEDEFLHHHLDPLAVRVRVTVLLGAASCFAFTFSDLARIGFGGRYALLLALRSFVMIAGIVFASKVRERPELALSSRIVTTLESSVLGVLFVVMAFRPGEIEINNLSISVAIVAFFLLVPNRFVPALAISTFAVVVNVVTVFVVGGPVERQLPSGLLLASFVLICAMSANQLQRARREEYVALRKERRSNDLLLDEISRRRDLEDELTWMANHDPLTDLLNRRAFYELAEREAARARRSEAPMSILVIDADEFKAVNDRYGHHAGDEALRRIAGVCRVHLRVDDVVGRIGGEEFAAIMPATDSDLAHEIAERLRVAVAEQPLEHADGDIELSVSIGVTEYRVWTETVIDGIERADEAMYLAKSSGRNCVVPV